MADSFLSGVFLGINLFDTSGTLHCHDSLVSRDLLDQWHRSQELTAILGGKEHHQQQNKPQQSAVTWRGLDQLDHRFHASKPKRKKKNKKLCWPTTLDHWLVSMPTSAPQQFGALPWAQLFDCPWLLICWGGTFWEVFVHGDLVVKEAEWQYQNKWTSSELTKLINIEYSQWCGENGSNHHPALWVEPVVTLKSGSFKYIEVPWHLIYLKQYKTIQKIYIAIERLITWSQHEGNLLVPLQPGHFSARTLESSQLLRVPELPATSACEENAENRACSRFFP